jgi:hypothetical protein
MAYFRSKHVAAQLDKYTALSDKDSCVETDIALPAHIKESITCLLDGFGGLVVSMLASGTQGRG